LLMCSAPISKVVLRFFFMASGGEIIRPINPVVLWI
jgi:hypothetical protein